MLYALVVNDTCSELVHVGILQLQFADVFHLNPSPVPVAHGAFSFPGSSARAATSKPKLDKLLNVVHGLVSVDLIRSSFLCM